jgi:hypothetical protein
MRKSMKRSFESLLSFSSFSIHNSSFSFTSPPWPPEAKIKKSWTKYRKSFKLYGRGKKVLDE